MLERCAGSASHLLVVLPGALQSPGQLLDAGFAAEAHARLPADLALIDYGDAFIGDFDNDVVLHRLHDALMPLQKTARYAQIWLCGMSIGGALAGAYADLFPGEVDGLCLLAPYPGNHMILREIRAAGLTSWQAPEGDCEVAHRLWRCLQRREIGAPDIHLAYGADDRYAPALSLMAGALDAERVHVVEGGHALVTWTLLWRHFLNRLSNPTGGMW